MSSVPYLPSVPAAVGEDRERIQILERVPSSDSEPSYAYCFSYVNPETVPISGSLRLATEDFYTNALDTVFSTGGAITPNNNATGDLYLHFHAAGLYLVYGDVFWDHTSTYIRDTWVDTSCTIFNQQELTAGASWNQKPALSDPLQERPIQYNIVDQYTLDNFPTFRHRVSKLVYNHDAGAAHDVLYHTLAAVYWPMTSNFQNVPDTDLVYIS